MYHNVSRGASPSAGASASRASKIDLENIEELQDAWCRRYEMLRDPPSPPQLNSPRSLRACAMGNVNPQSTLQKLSLKQHLFRVLGNASMISALPNSSTTEYKVLMQSALRSFQEATIGLGTSQEKLSAFIAFRNQEELRSTHLDSLRELRRQLVAEEVFEERKRHHHHHQHQHRRATGESGVSVRSNASASRRASSTQSRSSAQGSTTDALWSSKVEERARSRHTSVSSQQDSKLNISGQLISPIAASLSGSSGQRVPLSHHHGGAAETSFTSGAETKAGDKVCDRSGTADFTPTMSPSGKLPYKPRDVSSLNSSYFGNRSIQSTASNPSGAALPSTSANTSVVSPAPKRPALAQRHARFPLVPPPAAHNVQTATSNSTGEVDREASIRTAAQDNSGLDSVPKQDLSMVSLNSNQLDVLLNPVEGRHKAKPGVQQTAASEQGAVQHAVKLFHEAEQPTQASSETEVAKRNASSASAAPPPLQLQSVSAKSGAEGLPIAGAVSTPTSQPLTPRQRKGYTNHTNSPTQLVPNVVPRPGAMPAPSASVSVSECTPPPEGSEAKASSGPRTADPQMNTSELPATSKPSRTRAVTSGHTSSPVTASAAVDVHLGSFPPPAITQAEREDGFVYYCANPTRDVTKFYGGARFPIPGAVKL